MLAIRLARVGRKKRPLYRVVVSERSKDMYGNHLEILGQYNPHSKEINLKEDRVKYWLENGAQTSATVNNLLVKEGLLQVGKAKAVAISKKRHQKLDAKKAEAQDKAKAAEESKQSEESKEEAKSEEKPVETQEIKEAPAEEVKDEEKK